MQLGLIGLGKMGGNMAERLRLGGHQVVGFDFNADAVAKLTATRQRRRVSSLEDLAKKLERPQGHLDHGAAGQAGRRDDRQARAAAEPGRHPHRRRQLELQGLAAPLQGSYRQGISVCRRGHLGRRVGLERGLQHDDRRRQGSRRISAPHLRNARSRQRQGLGTRGPGRRRPLREDDAQRHRVRHDAGLCRGLHHHGEEGRARISTCRRFRRSGATAAWCAAGCSI